MASPFRWMALDPGAAASGFRLADTNLRAGKCGHERRRVERQSTEQQSTERQSTKRQRAWKPMVRALRRIPHGLALTDKCAASTLFLGAHYSELPDLTPHARR